MVTKKLEDYVIDIGPMGPIGESEALILRVTRNCPWNRCLFCSVYKDKKFGYRSVAEIKRDIDAVKRIEELIEATRKEYGLDEIIEPEAISNIISQRYSEIYGREPDNFTTENYFARLSLRNVLNWLIYGKKRVSLQDANALIMKPDELIEVLKYLKKTFPTIDIITSYARSKTCAQRSIKELEGLKEAGLSWLFVGIESGCDEVLKFMQKGVTAAEHIKGGQKVMEAGINMAAFVMPGLAGKNPELAEKHVSDTVRVLNEIKPTEVRIRSLAILEDSPLYPLWKSGEFEAPDDEQMIDEIEMIIKNLNFDCIFETLQMTNVLFNIRGRLSVEKPKMLASITAYKAKPALTRLNFRLDRYLYGGYLDFTEARGRYDSQLGELIKEAELSLEKRSRNAKLKIEQAILGIKSKGIP